VKEATQQIFQPLKIKEIMNIKELIYIILIILWIYAGFSSGA